MALPLLCYNGLFCSSGVVAALAVAWLPMRLFASWRTACTRESRCRVSLCFLWCVDAHAGSKDRNPCDIFAYSFAARLGWPTDNSLVHMGHRYQSDQLMSRPVAAPYLPGSFQRIATEHRP